MPPLFENPQDAIKCAGNFLAIIKGHSQLAQFFGENATPETFEAKFQAAKNYLLRKCRDEGTNTHGPAHELASSLDSAWEVFNTFSNPQKDDDPVRSVNEAMSKISTLSSLFEGRLLNYYKEYGYGEYSEDEINLVESLIRSMNEVNDYIIQSKRALMLDEYKTQIDRLKDSKRTHDTFVDALIDACHKAGFEVKDVEKEFNIQTVKNGELLIQKNALLNKKENEEKATIINTRIKEIEKQIDTKMAPSFEYDKKFKVLNSMDKKLELNRNTYDIAVDKLLSAKMSMEKLTPTFEESKASFAKAQERVEELNNAKKQVTELLDQGNNREIVKNYYDKQESLREVTEAYETIKRLAQKEIDDRNYKGDEHNAFEFDNYDYAKHLDDFHKAKDVLVKNASSPEDAKKLSDAFNGLSDIANGNHPHSFLIRSGTIIQLTMFNLSEELNTIKNSNGDLLESYAKLDSTIIENNSAEDQLRNAEEYMNSIEKDLLDHQKIYSECTDIVSKAQEEVFESIGKDFPGASPLLKTDGLKEIVDDKRTEYYKQYNNIINSDEIQILRDDKSRALKELDEISEQNIGFKVEEIDDKLKADKARTDVLESLNDGIKIAEANLMENSRRQCLVINSIKENQGLGAKQNLAARIEDIKSRIFTETKRNSDGTPQKSEEFKAFENAMNDLFDVACGKPVIKNDQELSLEDALKTAKDKATNYIKEKKKWWHPRALSSPQRHIRLSCATEMINLVDSTQKILNLGILDKENFAKTFTSRSFTVINKENAKTTLLNDVNNLVNDDSRSYEKIRNEKELSSGIMQRVRKDVVDAFENEKTKVKIKKQ